MNIYHYWQQSFTLETRNNTADSVATEFRLLEAALGILTEEIYSKTDVHMNNSTSHNKGIAKISQGNFTEKKLLVKKFETAKKTLGFGKGIPKTIHTIENKMRMIIRHLH